MIEATTNTAIYFPPPFPRVYGYMPPGATRRCEDEVYITGNSQEDINLVKQKLRDLVAVLKIYVKEAIIHPEKVDSIILERLDKIQKVMEANGCFVLLPQLGSGTSSIRVQGTDVLHVERTIRELMNVVSYLSPYQLAWSTTNSSRLVNFMVLHGGSWQTIHKCELRPQQTSEQCFLISVRILVRTSLSTT